MAASNDLLSSLYEKIVEEGVRLFNADIGEQKAITLKNDVADIYGIFFNYNKFDSSQEEFCVLAHEFGHCKTGATHKLYSPYQLICQHEHRANRAAVHEFLPIEKLNDAFEHGCAETWEVAEYLDIPEKFVILAIDIYTCEGELI